MTEMEPLFIDIVGYDSMSSCMQAIDLAVYGRKYAGVPTSVHVPCAVVSEMDQLLVDARAAGVRNIILEPTSAASSSSQSPLHTEAQSLQTGAVSQLVERVRSAHGDWFCIGVCGYPSSSSAEHVQQLRAAQSAGADFILAQHVLEAGTFLSYRSALVSAGVNVPLFPTILPIYSHSNFNQLNSYCNVTIPIAIRTEINRLQHDPAALQAYGVSLTSTLCRELLAAGVPVLHFVTMNLELLVSKVLRELGLTGPEAASRRKLPWRVAAQEARATEEMRPIFWANRPAAYVERTAHWTEFPAGRWKTARAESKDIMPFTPLSQEHLVPPSAGTPEQRRAIWGSNPTEERHVWAVFAGYMQGSVPRLPWCEKALLPETGTIASQLVRLNKEGFLTINSQPRVNGAKSDDPTFGWGGPGGLVYQKAYVECFCPPGHLAALMEAAAQHPSISFTAISADGTTFSSRRLDCAAAVTWGVYPDREVQQPTIVEYGAFQAWKNEAFELWMQQWAAAYEEESEAADLIAGIHATYFLVNVIDNDFASNEADIFAVFEAALRLRKEKGDRLPENLASALKLTVIQPERI